MGVSCRETNRATHTQAVALHYSPSEMVRSQPRCERMNLALIAMICNQVHAAEDAAMQVIHDAMRSKRTVFGHSLRDTYVRATPLLLAMWQVVLVS